MPLAEAAAVLRHGVPAACLIVLLGSLGEAARQLARGVVDGAAVFGLLRVPARAQDVVALTSANGSRVAATPAPWVVWRDGGPNG